MRIIAGEFSSRKIIAPKGEHTRPTLDKVREAVFSSLGGMFYGGDFLDLYGGSGANALEALSRGMNKAIIVDIDAHAIEAIKENIKNLQLENRTQVLKMKDTIALKCCADENMQFMVVYLDPPYAKQKNEKILQLLEEYHLLVDGAIVVIESSKDDIFKDEIGTLHKVKEIIYGTAKITYYKKEG